MFPARLFLVFLGLAILLLTFLALHRCQVPEAIEPAAGQAPTRVAASELPVPTASEPTRAQVPVERVASATVEASDEERKKIELVVVYRGTGMPVAGAEAFLFELEGERDEWNLLPRLLQRWIDYSNESGPAAEGTATCDAKGRASLPMRAGCGVWVRAPGFDGYRVFESEPRGPVRFALLPTRELLVRTIDEEGAPVPGASVVVIEQWSRPHMSKWCETISDELGIARIPGLNGLVPHTFRPWDEYLGLCPGNAGWRGAPTPVSLERVPEDPVPLIVSGWAQLDVELFDEDGEVLLGDGELMITGPEKPDAERCLVREVPVREGKGHFPRVAVGEDLELLFHDPEWKKRVTLRLSPFAAGERRTVRLTVGPESELDTPPADDFSAEPAARTNLAGIVVDDLGKPIPGAEVDVWSLDPEGHVTGAPGINGAISDERGRFSGHIATELGGGFALDAYADHHVAIEDQPVTPGTTDLRVVLARTATVEGSVLLDPGILPFDLNIQLEREDDLGGPHDEHFDPGGNFRLTGIDPGIVRVVFLVLDGSSVWESPPLRVESGEHQRPDFLRDIDLRGRVQLLLLELVDEKGRPAHAELSFAPAGSDVGDTYSAAFGRDPSRFSTTTAGLDVTIGGRNFREVKLFGIHGRHRVTVVPTPVITLELPADLPGDGDGVRLEIWHRGPEGRDFIRDLRFEARLLECTFPYPGTFELEWSYCPCGLGGFVAHDHQELHDKPIELEVRDLRERQFLTPEYPVEAHRAVYEGR